MRSPAQLKAALLALEVRPIVMGFDLAQEPDTTSIFDVSKDEATGMRVIERMVSMLPPAIPVATKRRRKAAS